MTIINRSRVVWMSAGTLSAAAVRWSFSAPDAIALGIVLMPGVLLAAGALATGFAPGGRLGSRFAATLFLALLAWVTVYLLPLYAEKSLPYFPLAGAASGVMLTLGAGWMDRSYLSPTRSIAAIAGGGSCRAYICVGLEARIALLQHRSREQGGCFTGHLGRCIPLGRNVWINSILKESCSRRSHITVRSS